VRGSVWSSCTVAGNLAKTVSPNMLAFLTVSLGWRWAFFGPGGVALLATVVRYTQRFPFESLQDTPFAPGLPL
jgi:sugar phosphate permease